MEFIYKTKERYNSCDNIIRRVATSINIELVGEK